MAARRILKACVMGTMGISCGWVHFFMNLLCLSVDRLEMFQCSTWRWNSYKHRIILPEIASTQMKSHAKKTTGCNMLSCRWITEQLKWKRTWPLSLCFPNVCLNHNRPLCGTCACVTRPIQQMDGRTETRRPRSEWLIGVWKCFLASTACRTLCSERDGSEKNKSLPRQ